MAEDVADSPLDDDAIDPPSEAKKLSVVRSPARNAAGIVGFWLALIAVALLITAMSLVQADRTARIPVVTWGPIAALEAMLGGSALVAGGVLSVVGLARESGTSGPAALGLVLCIWAAGAVLFYLALLYED